jgi:predicted phage tail component-like protein
MIESLYFTYDGIDSRDMKVIQISTGNGLYDEHFLADSQIVEDYVPGNDVPYYIRTERKPIVLPLSIYFENELTDEEARKVGRWLTQDYYKPLIFDTNPHKIYYAKFIGNPRLLHNGCKQGYATLEMRCNAPHAYSPVYTESFDLSNNTVSGTSIKITNNGDFSISPIIELEKVEDGNFSIVHLNAGGKEMKIDSLSNGEKLIIDCETEEIETDIVGVLRYKNSNDVFIDLHRGVNHLKVYGKCKLTFKYELLFN